MDYTRQPFWFKLRKSLRYTRLYGISRTLIKVKGQYHMSKNYSVLPERKTVLNAKGNVGLIGCGNYAFSNIAYYLKKNYGNVIRAAMDIDINRAASIYETYGMQYYTSDASEFLDDPEITLIYIASNHASHAEYAIAALERGKDVHIEKPHVVREDQLIRLLDAMQSYSGRVLSVGFNRPYSRIGRMIHSHLQTQTGPALLSWFIAGHQIPPDHWYFQEKEGGRVLGNLCHWTDFTFQMVDENARYPILVNPTRWQKSDCDIGVNYVFGDGTIAALTFSAKGHAFEGVKERFAAHRGNVLITMDDFQRLVIDNISSKTRFRPLFRDHGHEVSITRSYQLHQDRSDTARACTPEYVWNTGELFLKTKQALESNTPCKVLGYKARSGNR